MFKSKGNFSNFPKDCIKLCVENKIKCSKAIEMMTVAFGESTLIKKHIYKWYKRFTEGREDVNDDTERSV